MPPRPLEDPQACVAVVGAGLAGLRAAEALRREGYRGRLVLLGDEDHPPYDRPPLSKAYLAGNLPPERLALRPPEKLAELDLDLQLGRRAAGLEASDHRLVLEDGEELAADGLVLATGALPKTFPLPPLRGLHVLRRPEDADQLAAALFDPAPAGAPERPRRLVVLGAGFIGCEVAATVRERGGVAVTVVDPLAVPLGRVLPEAFGRALQAVHEANGVRFLLGKVPQSLLTDHGRRLPLGRPSTLVAAGPAPAAAGASPAGGGSARAPQGQERVQAVVLDDQEVEADAVLVAVGVAPATGWLAGSGLELDDGLVLDPALRAAPGIVGCGDLARWPHPDGQGLVRLEHWTNAAEQGTQAARALLAEAAGAEPPPFQTVPYVWSDQYDLKIQVLGWPGPEDELVALQGSLDPEDLVETRRLLAGVVRRGRLQGAIGIGLPRPLMLLRPLVQRAAPLAEAVELLSQGAPGPRPGRAAR
ncbi:NAD(P)/FAD-dependent oxidoreductase [Aciditerrimonas ferrireducens]|nr:FAD-dependent oxidoreductase [Aciditerrimonas ferrireducens]MCK4177312.1 FAD-dependent oxidoreductase [Aciditerrimonas ferrireducens]